MTVLAVSLHMQQFSISDMLPMRWRNYCRVSILEVRLNNGNRLKYPQMRQLGTRFRVSEEAIKSPGSTTDTSGVKRPVKVGMSLRRQKRLKASHQQVHKLYACAPKRHRFLVRIEPGKIGRSSRPRKPPALDGS